MEQGRDPVNALFGIASVHSATHMACHAQLFIDSVFMTIPSSCGDGLLYIVRRADVRTLDMVRRLLPSRILPTSETRQDDQCRASALTYFHGIAKCEDAARGLNFELSVKNKAGGLILTQLLVIHRPLDI